MTKRADDSDETEGRRMYRTAADTLARSQVSMAKRGVRMSWYCQMCGEMRRNPCGRNCPHDTSPFT